MDGAGGIYSQGMHFSALAVLVGATSLVTAEISGTINRQAKAQAIKR